ncbi:MAG: hypothetical protein HXY28_15185 [Hydrogenophilaceae bacterium]|jgi:hypothetical protein|nr:hypothetical protein [Hydrogenophilaceae bacterium]
MSTREEDEARAEAWLVQQRYAPSRPTWLPAGRNPDFWAEAATLAPPHLWAEVKSIDEDDSTAALVRAQGILARTEIPPQLHGQAVLNVEPNAIEQSILWVLKAFAEHAPRFANQKVVLAFVQQTREGRDVRRAEIASNPPEFLWVRGAGEAPMHRPIRVCEQHYADAKVIYPRGSVRVGKTYEFFEYVGHEASLVVRLDPQDRPLDHIASMSGGSTQTRERATRALEDANSQIKAACETRAAPGIVILTPRGPFASDTMIAMAAYGALTVPLTLKDDGVEHGEMFHGRDGVFRPNKNRHVSAAIHLRHNGSATFFPNPFAHHPIADDAPIFDGAVRANVEF